MIFFKQVLLIFITFLQFTITTYLLDSLKKMYLQREAKPLLFLLDVSFVVLCTFLGTYEVCKDYHFIVLSLVSYSFIFLLF